MNFKEKSVENLAHLQQELTNDINGMKKQITDIETQIGMHISSISSHSSNISKLDALIQG